MSKLRCHISISLDGFVAGPNQSEENPLGEGGERLHDWVFPLEAFRRAHGGQGGEVNESTPVVEESRENIGAAVMGRNMFGPVRGGAWGDEQWTGWWGDNPPYHYPVFIVTHYRRDPVEMEGGTTFHFVTDGNESALGQAKKAAAGKDVMLWAAARSLGSTWQRDCWTSSSCTSFRCCSVAVLASLTTSGRRMCDSSRSGPSRRPASPTSSTGSCRVLRHDRRSDHQTQR
jgi:dihydrofolate reductase